MEGLDEFLLPGRWSTTTRSCRSGWACEYLSSRLVRPGVVNVLEHVATARVRAREETSLRVAPLSYGPTLLQQLEDRLTVGKYALDPWAC